MVDQKLRYLDALDTEGHFERAATACGVTQPSLSKAIRQLESELGVNIIKRGPRFSGLTQQGQIVLAWARQRIAETERLRENLREAGEGFSGLLRVGVLPATFPLMTIFTVPFSKAHPNVNLKVTSHDARGILRAFENDEIDIAITYVSDLSPDRNRYRILFEEEYELLARRGTPWGDGLATWTDLTRIPLCVMPPKALLFNPDAVELLNGILKKTQHIITTSILMVMDHVRTGKWATVLPKCVRITIAGDQDIRAIALPKTNTSYPIGIALPQVETQSWLAESFFNIATSPETLKRLNDLLTPNARNLRNTKKTAGSSRGAAQKLAKGNLGAKQISSGTRSSR